MRIGPVIVVKEEITWPVAIHTNENKPFLSSCRIGEGIYVMMVSSYVSVYICVGCVYM